MVEFAALPCFPLHTVFFPGFGGPLQIFEERYKQLLAAALRGGRRFAVVGIKGGVEVGGPAVPYDVGCLVEIGQVADPHDGEIYIVNVGALERVRLADWDHQSKPYLLARATLWPDEDDPTPPAQAVQEAGALFNRYLAALLHAAGHDERAAGVSLPLLLPGEPTILSYLIAALVQVPNPARQELLEAPSAGARLAAEIRLLGHELALLRQSGVGPPGPPAVPSHFSTN